MKDRSNYTRREYVQKQIPRRKLLQTSWATMAVGLIPVTVSANQQNRSAGPNDPSEREIQTDPGDVFNTFEERYGRSEAKAIWDVLESYIESVENGRMSNEDAYNQATKELLQSPDTSSIAAEIEREHNLLERIESQRSVLSDNSSESKNSSNQSTDVSLPIVDGDEGRQRSGNGSYQTNYDIDGRSINQYAGASLYGSSTAWARLYSWSATVSSGRHVRLTAEYYRRGSLNSMTGDASAEINLFMCESSDREGTMVRKTVENPGTVRGTVTQSAQFYMSNYTSYEFGIEIIGNVSAIGGYTYSDYWTHHTGRRRVELEESLSLTYLD
ncbi:hypothetical protein [Halovivax gelatinilyticus]|uniref:hypothetical protein n=1 Tax=Halovivax gelatinilyticus TaxID=2961597 RepID=UPI0020CA9322|nr:hypothetical protein [Halovivax gelatinilyticus]